MKNIKPFYLLLLALSALSVSCGRQQPVVILFDNDVHCAMELYPKMAYQREEALRGTPHVAVVSAGDFVQGDAVGSLSEGEMVADVMNAVPYDMLTLGNHEFDYGMEQQQRLCRLLKAQTLCCNFSRKCADGSEEDIYPSYSLRRYGGMKVAFIGAMTPTSYTSSTPSYFCDAEGRLLYDFHACDTYSRIQQAADDARGKGADYVIVLSHLGDDSSVCPSLEMVSQTRGIDVVLDGHAHHLLDLRLPNADGDTVLLLSTGARAAYIGSLSIMPDGTLRHAFLQCDTLPDDPEVAALLARTKDKLQAQINTVVGYSELPLSDKDGDGQRLVRCGETSLAWFVADAMRYVTGAQTGAIHGGSLRSALPQGDITLGDLIALMPFNNHAAVVTMTGQQLLDAIEVSVARWPAENGDFHIFSGLRYTINPDIPSSVMFDDKQLFVSVGGTRRVVKAEVEKADRTGWADIDPSATYTIGGLDYALWNLGSSGMYRYATPVKTPSENAATATGDTPKDTEMLLLYLRHIGDTIRATQYPAVITEPRFSVER